MAQNTCEEACPCNEWINQLIVGYVNQACCQPMGEACDQACNACVGRLCEGCAEALCAGMCQSCTCGCCSSSSVSSISPLIGSIIFTLVTMFVLGVLQAFDPKGPFFLTMLAGAILAVSLTGIRFTTGTCKGNCDSVKEKVCDSVKTTWGRFTFVHSHHQPHLREAGHEFKIGNKYFCTGCYGTLIGTTIVLIFMSAYVLFGLTANLVFLITLAVPICLVPTILRYAIFKQMRTPLRLLSNILLPIGSGLLFILCDYTYHSWIVNVGLVLLILMISFVRITASSKENSAPETLPIVLPVM
ncbi:MAG: hypothetical protein ACFFDI_12415 [Promethearchaeota archaeon]